MLRPRPKWLSELESLAIEVRIPGRADLRRIQGVPTDTGGSTDVTGRIVVPTNLASLHGELFGGVSSSLLPQELEQDALSYCPGWNGFAPLSSLSVSCKR